MLLALTEYVEYNISTTISMPTSTRSHLSLNRVASARRFLLPRFCSIGFRRSRHLCTTRGRNHILFHVPFRSYGYDTV